MADIGKEAFEKNKMLHSILASVGKEDAEKKAEVEEQYLYEVLMKKPLLTGHDIINFPAEPNDYLIENFLWKNSIGIILGQEKACKSIITVQKGMAMTCGRPFLKCYDVARPLKVLYLQAESDLGETKERFLNATQEGGIKWNPDNWRHLAPAAMCLDIDGEPDEYGEYQEGTYNNIIKRINDDGFRPDVIIIDPLYMAMEGDLNDNKAVRHFCRNVRKMKDTLNCAIIVVHHEHRGYKDKQGNNVDEGDNAIFGSSMLKNFASHVLQITICNSRGRRIQPREEEQSPIKYRKLACHTQRNGNVAKPVVLKLVENPLMLEIVDLEDSNPASVETVYRNIQSNGSMASCDIIRQTGMSESTVRKAMSRLKEDDRIEILEKKANKTFYKTTGR